MEQWRYDELRMKLTVFSKSEIAVMKVVVKQGNVCLENHTTLTAFKTSVLVLAFVRSIICTTKVFSSTVTCSTEKHSCQASESTLRLFCTDCPTWQGTNAKVYFKATF